MKIIQTTLSICIAIVCLTMAACSIFRTQPTTDQNELETIKEFYLLTEKYTYDTTMFNSTLDSEKSRYVNQRSPKDWGQIKRHMRDFYLDRIVSTNFKTLIDSLTLDTIKYYTTKKILYKDIDRIYRLTRKENIYKLIDSLFIDPLLENRNEKFAKAIEDDCNRFKEGKFELRDSDLFTFKIERNGVDEHTYSDHDDDEWFAKIIWLANNKYLEMTADRQWPNPNYDTTVVNIYETTDTSYYYVSKDVKYNKYYEGYVVKIE